MIALNLAGITFLDKEVIRHCLLNNIHIEKKCFVIMEGNEANRYDADFSVNVNVENANYRIGWIPRTHTVMKYMNQAYKKKDNEAYARQSERFRLLEILRGNIYTDITTNKIMPIGEINNMLFIQDEKFYNEGSKERKLASISCQFQYPNP